MMQEKTLHEKKKKTPNQTKADFSKAEVKSDGNISSKYQTNKTVNQGFQTQLIYKSKEIYADRINN